MPFITYAERRGLERGLIQGRQQAVEAVLAVRFGDAALALMPRVR